MQSEDQEAREREIDFLMARRGIEIPRDRKAGVIAVYTELARMAALLQQPREAASEPANVFSLDALLRGR